MQKHQMNQVRALLCCPGYGRAVVMWRGDNVVLVGPIAGLCKEAIGPSHVVFG